MSNKNLLTGRPGLEEHRSSHPLSVDVGKLAAKHGLAGCVLVSFTKEKVGVSSSGHGDFALAMEKLGDAILAAIDDGRFDPERIALLPAEIMEAASIGVGACDFCPAVHVNLLDKRGEVFATASVSAQIAEAFIARFREQLTQLAGRASAPAQRQ